LKEDAADVRSPYPSYIRPEIEALQPSGIARIALQRLGDPGVIPLWFGEGNRVTPEFIREAAKQALDEGETFYTFTRGTEHLRESIGNYLQAVYGVDVHPDRITMPGSSMLCVTIATQMALRAGDHAVLVSPHWPNIEANMRITGCDISPVRQRRTDEGWQLTAAEIIAAARPQTRCIFVNSPCNPTGWVMPVAEQQQLLEFCRQRQILLIADEVYHRMDYGADAAPSFLPLAKEDDPVIIIYGLSKSWAMTGWRLGWVVAPRALLRPWQILSENFNTGATVFAQRAAAAALSQGEPLVSDLREHYDRGRQLVMEVLASHPRVELAEPQGAFYAFPRIDGITSSMDFAQALLEREDVGVAPGYAFGPDNDAHVRICFARDHDQLEEGLQRIRRHLDRG
jgi:aspartate/methionine/tyrosine aminotransferase